MVALQPVTRGLIEVNLSVLGVKALTLLQVVRDVVEHQIKGQVGKQKDGHVQRHEPDILV